MRTRILLPTLAATALAGGCATPEPVADLADISTDAPVQQAVSLLGEPLYPMALTAGQRDERMANLRQAVADYEANPLSEDTIIWLGRRYAYLGRYDLAIDMYTEGLALHPDSFKLLRHRGHRYISTRRFDLAIADLERAASLIEGVPDEIEPDGLPNRLDQPTSTSHTNIYYHLGLAHYLTGDYERAQEAYDQCLHFIENADMLVATVYWMYLTQRRAGMPHAEMLLEPIGDQMQLIENTTYHRLLLLYRGRLEPEDVAGDGDEIQSATAAYGVARWYGMQGDEDEMLERLERLVSDPAWPAFGHIAAEADVSRITSP